MASSKSAKPRDKAGALSDSGREPHARTEAWTNLREPTTAPSKNPVRLPWDLRMFLASVGLAPLLLLLCGSEQLREATHDHLQGARAGLLVQLPDEPQGKSSRSISETLQPSSSALCAHGDGRLSRHGHTTKHGALQGHLCTKTTTCNPRRPLIKICLKIIPYGYLTKK